MALWRVLDLYKRAASRRGQAPAKQLTYLGNFTPKKSFAKNNTNSDLFSEFVLFAYGGLNRVKYALAFTNIFYRDFPRFLRR